ncbi:unnamed protein product [Nippostrongylus brasiliensis]|uniref:Transposase n=1 Tax=Nippostrongylus brasiliensis TaxID=27835 RepID=A0A0N4Y6B5_NIPBR|nr:unnamed protein product [Nippostrongylus brasiliensis]
MIILGLMVGSWSFVLRQQGIAPSLALDRINRLRDSIEKLQYLNGVVRCRMKEWQQTRTKRFIGPAQNLHDLIGTLSLTLPESPDDC